MQPQAASLLQLYVLPWALQIPDIAPLFFIVPLPSQTMKRVALS